ncbi:MAG: nucleotidyltransferase family protein [Mediterranea sp.]|jgi:hypothetical protein|nr:nucleotidyltransferase family protein [Mediterranea sp.]
MGKNEKEMREVFLELMRAGLWGSTPALDGFPLTDDEWVGIHTQARRQTVDGIVYDGVLRLPDELLPPTPLLMRWTAEIDGLERVNKRMNKDIAALFRWIKGNDLNAWLLKGQGVAACYEQPLHRRCGDIDIYFPNREDLEKMNLLLREKGVVVQPHANAGGIYRGGEFVVEQHIQMADIYRPSLVDYLQWLKHLETRNAVRWYVEGQTVLLPSPILAHLISTAHIFKHAMVFGIGFRQLCDAARLSYYYSDRIDSRLLEDVFRRTGIYRWAISLYRMQVSTLGLPEEYLPFPLPKGEESYPWMENVWKGGNFGLYNRGFSASKSPQSEKRHIGQAALNLCSNMRYAPGEAFWFSLKKFYWLFVEKQQG